MVKVCVGFYGLTRSLKYTFPNLQKTIFQPLKNAGIEYDVALHTYNMKKLTNLRSKEFNVKLDQNEYKLLKPKWVCITNQARFDRKYRSNLKRINAKGNPWKKDDNGQSLKNLTRQLNSLHILSNIIPTNEEYDLFIFIRPDQIFKNPLNIIEILNLTKPGTIITPNWGHYGGVNDRLAIGEPNVIRAWARRINLVDEYIINHKLHSESFNKFTIEKYEWDHVTLRIICYRIRSNGGVKVDPGIPPPSKQFFTRNKNLYLIK